MKFKSFRNNDISGRIFGDLTVLKFAGKAGAHYKWTVRCSCGTSFDVLATALKTGNTQRCIHCSYRLRAAKSTKHGEARLTKEYNTWARIKDRCHNPKNAGYDKYGARGIKVCEKWRHSFTSFLDDVGRAPTPAHSINRIDNNGNYEPGNVEWATSSAQANNTRANRLISFRGKTKTLAQWATHLNIRPALLRQRITRDKWPLERALQ